jgi:hypothetical protein
MKPRNPDTAEKWECHGTVYQLFRIPMKIVRLIKMCLNEIYSKAHTLKNLTDAFPNQNGVKQGIQFIANAF